MFLSRTLHAVFGPHPLSQSVTELSSTGLSSEHRRSALAPSPDLLHPGVYKALGTISAQALNAQRQRQRPGFSLSFSQGMSLCKDCTKGVTHDGTPAGKWEALNGVETYVATPEIEYPKDKAVLFMTDIFGPRMINIQLLADDYARNGFKVYVPDIVNGDPVPTAILSGDTSISIPEWLKDHGPEQTTPTVEKAIAALRAQGIKEIGACGFCFGARYCFNLAFAGELKVAVVSHPSLLEIADIEKYSKTKVPLLVNSCEFDDLFSDEVRDGFDQALGGGNFAPGYKRTYFEGCTHGFSVRGDLSNPKVLAGKEGAFKASIEWLLRYL